MNTHSKEYCDDKIQYFAKILSLVILKRNEWKHDKKIIDEQNSAFKKFSVTGKGDKTIIRTMLLMLFVEIL